MEVSRLVFKSGPDQGSNNLEIQPGKVTVFIGPNNGGNSSALKEIFAAFYPEAHHSQKIFSDIQVPNMTQDELEAKISVLTSGLTSRIPNDERTYIFSNRARSEHIDLINLRSTFQNLPIYPENMKWIKNKVHSHFVLNLSGENRLQLANSAQAQNPKLLPQSTIQEIFRNDGLRAEVSKIVRDAFGQFLLVNPTQMTMINYALADSMPANPATERSFGDEAVEYFSHTQDVSQASDGTKAFIGLITEVMAGIHDVLVIDEPEAFLHPGLAHSLGREICRNSKDGKQIFAATHSPQFILGCLSAGAPIDIVRLTYQNGIGTARLLPSTEVEAMMRDPMLRSVNVVSALFFDCAIVTEGNSDRAFYEEINNRILTFGEGGIKNAIFLHSHTKQATYKIIQTLRRAGIPAASIYDIDWIKEDGNIARNYIAGAGIPEATREGFIATRRSIRQSLERASVGKDYKRDGGIDLLQGGELEAANEFFDQASKYGLFTVRGGEVEQWLSHLGVSKRKDSWLPEMFERIGSDPSHPEYVKPTEGDVWEFIRAIATWASNPTRRGMSSN